MASWLIEYKLGRQVRMEGIFRVDEDSFDASLSRMCVLAWEGICSLSI